MFYITIFSLLVVVGYINIDLLHKPKDRSIYILFVTVFFILSFTRWERGTDWNSYLLNFEFSRNSVIHNFELGYAYLSYFVKQITDDYTIMLFVCALLIFPIKYYAVYKLSDLSTIALLVSFSVYFADIFFVRQNIAMAIDFFSILYIFQRKPLKFTILVLFSCLFHASSVVFLFAYKIFYMRWTRKKMYIVISTFLIWFFIYGAMANVIFSLLFSNGAKIALYFDSGKDKDLVVGGSVLFYIIKGIIVRVLLLWLIYILRHRIRMTESLKGFINLYTFGLLIFALSTQIAIPLGRIAQYFYQIEILIIPAILINSLTYSNKRTLYCIIVMYLFVRLYGNISGGYAALYIPFKFFWENIPVNIF